MGGGVGRVKLLAVGSFLKGGLAGWYREAWLELCAEKVPFLVVSINHPTAGGLWVSFNSTVLAQVALWCPFWVYLGPSEDKENELQLIESASSVLDLPLEEVF